MNQRVSPDNSNSPGSKGGRSNSVQDKYVGELLLLVRQYEHQIDVLENKNEECGTQATAHLVEKVAHLEDQLKSKDEQLHLRTEQLHLQAVQLKSKEEQLKNKEEQLQQAAVLDKTKPKGAAKSKKVGNGWILFMKQRSLEKDLGEKFPTLDAFLEYSKDNGAKVKKPKKRDALPKKGKGVGLKEFLKEMSEEYKALDKKKKTEYNDAAKKLALSETETEKKGVHMHM
jgi:hypothetical protein